MPKALAVYPTPDLEDELRRRRRNAETKARNRVAESISFDPHEAAGRIAITRERMGLRPEDLARICGLDPLRLSELEAYAERMRVDELLALAAALDVKVMELVPELKRA